MTDWTDLGACAGLSDAGAIFYPERGASILPAQEVCSSCEVWLPCLVSSLRSSKIHFASAEGVWGGAGGAVRRALFVALRDVDHPPERTCRDPECGWCATLKAHRTNLDIVAGTQPREARVVIDSNGSGATHGRKSTSSRGCRCWTCSFARSAVGKRLADAGVDVVEWLEAWFEPIADHPDAPVTTGQWLEVDAEHAEFMLSRAKFAAAKKLAELEVAA